MHQLILIIILLKNVIFTVYSNNTSKIPTHYNFTIDADRLSKVQESQLVSPEMLESLWAQESTCYRAPLAKNVTSFHDQCRGSFAGYACAGKCVSIDAGGRLQDVGVTPHGRSMLICQKCSPVKFRKEKITLTCNDKSQKQKLIKIIEKCACSACWKFCFLYGFRCFKIKYTWF